MKFETLIAMGAGALAYHMYRRVASLEDVVAGILSGEVVTIDKASFDIASQDVHTEDSRKFGFGKH